LLKLSDFTGFQTAILLLPALKSLLGDAQFAGKFRYRNPHLMLLDRYNYLLY